MSAIRWWPTLSPLVRAALLMLLGSSCVAVQLCAIRIASATLHPFEVVLFRNLIGFPVIAPFVGRLGLHALRIHRPEPMAVGT
jgi:drug/metabolite transporter (DMT)-like permease